MSLRRAHGVVALFVFAPSFFRMVFPCFAAQRDGVCRFLPRVEAPVKELMGRSKSAYCVGPFLRWYTFLTLSFGISFFFFFFFRGRLPDYALSEGKQTLCHSLRRKLLYG